MKWGPEIRSVRELLAAIAAGGKLERCVSWKANEETGWRQYWLDEKDGTRHPVRMSIVVVAERKGLVKLARVGDSAVTADAASEAPWSARDEADARGDWEYHCRKDDEGPPCS